MKLTWMTAIVLLLSVFSNTYAKTYYVNNNGNDSYTGLSHDQAWASINKVNSFPFNSGDDVYFKIGDSWSGKVLIIDWSGVAGNQSIIGSYHVSGSNVVLGVPTAGNLPIIQGGYKTTTDIGNVPTHHSSGLVIIKGDYVTVRNLHIKDSSGNGIIVDGAGGEGHNHVIIENNKLTHMLLG